MFSWRKVANQDTFIEYGNICSHAEIKWYPSYQEHITLLYLECCRTRKFSRPKFIFFLYFNTFQCINICILVLIIISVLTLINKPYFRGKKLASFTFLHKNHYLYCITVLYFDFFFFFFFFLIFKENKTCISWNSSARKMIHMKCPILFSLKNNNKTF